MSKNIIKIVLLLVIAISINAQQKTATYQDLSPNFFLSYKQPVGIAILKFEGSNDLHTKLYDELKIQSGIHSKFTIFPYEILEQQKGVLGIKGAIIVDNQRALKILRKNLEVELVVSGSYVNNLELIMKIYRTNDGQEVFTSKYEKSTKSTSIKDAVILFSEVKITNYIESLSYYVENGPKIKVNVTCPQTVTDPRDGRVYKTVLIGTQCWLKENLNVGTMIEAKQDSRNNAIIEKYCFGDYPANCDKYGGSYQWSEAMQYVTTQSAKGICPDGWHMPTLAEFETLKNSISGNGNSLKAVGQGGGSGAGSNISGFSALLAGYRGGNGDFGSLGSYATFWSSTEYDATDAYGMDLGINGSNVYLDGSNKGYGFSVRCLKD